MSSGSLASRKIRNSLAMLINPDSTVILYLTLTGYLSVYPLRDVPGSHSRQDVSWSSVAHAGHNQPSEVCVWKVEKEKIFS